MDRVRVREVEVLRVSQGPAGAPLREKVIVVVNGRYVHRTQFGPRQGRATREDEGRANRLAARVRERGWIEPEHWRREG